MKFLLITPPYHSGVVESAGVWMNVAFVYLAGALRARGHQPIIYDAMSYYHDHDRIQEEIANVAPDVIALTGITASVLDCAEVCRRAKAARPDLVTILGNTHPTFMWREVLDDHPCVDYVVRGEGEVTLGELADAIASGADVATVRGVCYRQEGQAVATPPRPLLHDLDRLESAWDLIDWPTYTYRPRPGSTLAVVSSSRGCIQQCSFCSQQLFWQTKWRGRDPERFVSELQMLRREYGVSVAMLADETPTTDMERWHRILDLLINRDVGVELLMETRVDDVLRDAQMLPRYREAGITHIYVGVEATRQATLDLYKKEISVEQGRRAIELINAADIVSETSFVLGMPDETPATIADTIELAKHYGPDMAFFLAITPWPYSDLHAQLKDHIETTDYRQYNLTQAVIRPDGMPREEVTRALGSAAHQFFAHKFQNLDGLSSFKRKFLVKVAAILLNHSYLGKEMADLRGKMPGWG